MSNTHSFNLTPLDKLVLEIPPHERRQIMLDFDELERTGKNGDTPLRLHAGRIYQTLQGRPSGFDAAYMMFVAYSVHKIAAIDAMNAAESLDHEDQRNLSFQLVSKIAELPLSDQNATVEECIDNMTATSERLDDIIRQAKGIVGMSWKPAAPTDDSPSP